MASIDFLGQQLRGRRHTRARFASASENPAGCQPPYLMADTERALLKLITVAIHASQKLALRPPPRTQLAPTRALIQPRMCRVERARLLRREAAGRPTDLR